MKTAELTGAALDWVVAKITNPDWWADGYMDGDPRAALDMDDGTIYSPSTNWAQGGPIIEREIFNLSDDGAQWIAESHNCMGYGPTALIAAMRCYVANKLGDVVDVPDALMGAA